MSSRKELAGVRIDICSLREALHKIEHYLASDGLHAVETVSMKTVVTAGEDEQVRQCLENMDLVVPSDKEILMELGVTSRKWLDEAREHRFASEALRGVIRAKYSVYLLCETRTQMDTLCKFLRNSFLEMYLMSAAMQSGRKPARMWSRLSMRLTRYHHR